MMREAQSIIRINHSNIENISALNPKFQTILYFEITFSSMRIASNTKKRL